MNGSTNGSHLEGAAAAPGVAGAVDSGKPDPTLADPAVSERYRVIETLARRPQDALYLARRLDTGSLIELRVLSAELGADDKLVQAVREQAALVARVASHCPGIATVYECERVAGGALVLAAEHPEGATLREVIRREGTLNLERALRLAIRIARALERAHNLSLVHGGLRPENVVLVGPEETVVLTHFGFDRLLASRPAAATGPDASVPEDSVYQAPEQASGHTTERSDIYAFGAILYQMLAGAPPSSGRASRRFVDPKPLRKSRPDVTPTLERLIMQTLQAAPERRPMDISVVCNDLWAEISAEGPGKLPGPRPVAGPWRGTRTKRLVVWGGLAVIGALAVWFAQTLMPLSRPRATAPMAAAPGTVGAGARNDAPPSSPAGRPSSPAPAAGSVSPAGRPPDLRHGQKPPAGRPSPPSAAIPAKPAEPVASGRSDDRDKPAAPRSPGGEVPGAQRPKAPVASRPEPSPEAREPADDPGAIIDWLLTEGAGQRR